MPSGYYTHPIAHWLILSIHLTNCTGILNSLLIAGNGRSCSQKTLTEWVENWQMNFYTISTQDFCLLDLFLVRMWVLKLSLSSLLHLESCQICHVFLFCCQVLFVSKRDCVVLPLSYLENIWPISFHQETCPFQWRKNPTTFSHATMFFLSLKLSVELNMFSFEF